MQSHGNSQGKLYIVGTGPGSPDMLTGRAVEAIRTAEYIIGNTFYLTLIGPFIAGKQVIPSPMGGEVERAKQCIDLARRHTVAMVSGGDPGVYGMASIVLEVLDRSGETIDVEVVPGVTAATACAARIGSPLSGDHITISLSNLLTPLEVIEKRLDLAFRMGVPVVLYNPRSRGRPDNLKKALGIALRHCDPETPVGIIRNAYRPGEITVYSTIESLINDDSAVDMHTLVIVGGEESRFMKEGDNVRGIITPRGYDRKYVY
ncbi:MAG: cobalt-precorrin-3B C(17)-methyltransferase [Methanoculleus sp. SDB]|nr:MAG: cobalt-precorrin-3B C(17)-methyltransferase [Methanoculleus sp. SDB]